MDAMALSRWKWSQTRKCWDGMSDVVLQVPNIHDQHTDKRLHEMVGERTQVWEFNVGDLLHFVGEIDMTEALTDHHFEAKTIETVSIDDRIQREITRLKACLPRSTVSDPIKALKGICENLKMQVDFIAMETETTDNADEIAPKRFQVHVLFKEGDVTYKFVSSGLKRSKKQAREEAASFALGRLAADDDADIEQLLARAVTRILSH
eukprot:TRINITY_DN9312_c0_g2_i1.p1 TRINITY_DN9312_c0_g2~~TRINITY_DN9312_c0_g2_i1.p1  ORF type:complete len:207 (+),score=40.79 TRINITY_DN9312_c0_g2_i1:2081-2701(+)